MVPGKGVPVQGTARLSVTRERLVCRSQRQQQTGVQQKTGRQATVTPEEVSHTAGRQQSGLQAGWQEAADASAGQHSRQGRGKQQELPQPMRELQAGTGTGTEGPRQVVRPGSR